jgi:ABC-type Fe3+/spermidine/putrescine transport system ATPase subunit
MSDRIAVMSAGRVLQLGSPREIYLQPVSASVARIVGNVNVLRGTVVGEASSPEATEVQLASGKVLRCRKSDGAKSKGEVEIVFRPELVKVELDRVKSQAEPADGSSVNAIVARVGRIDFTGDHLKVEFETDDGPVVAKLAPDIPLSKGGEATLLVKAEHCVAQ